jgi:hypothetical protein
MLLSRSIVFYSALWLLLLVNLDKKQNQRRKQRVDLNIMFKKKVKIERLAKDSKEIIVQKETI